MTLSFSTPRLRTLLLILLGLAITLWGVFGTVGALNTLLHPAQTAEEDGVVLEEETILPEDQGFVPMIAPAQTGALPQSAPVISAVEEAAVLRAEQLDRGGQEALIGAAAATPAVVDVSPALPDRIVIPQIDLDAPVVQALSRKVRIGSETYGQWLAPGFFAAGWHRDSAPLGQVGNTVINGHHNVDGKVFAHLVDLKEGDRVIVYAGERRFEYLISNKLILPERFVSMDKRGENARWIGQSQDERLTLITCWPADSNTHRLILVAQPVR